MLKDVDWAATPVGPISSWSPALRNAVDLTLGTQFPVTLFWGPEFVLIYNEAFVPLIADKHPGALGTPAQVVFPEAWDTIGPMMRSVYAGEGATWVENAHVPLWRHGLLEEAYFTFSYSPVRSADGTIEGVMDIATETTRQVIDRRRLQTLNRLREVLGGLEQVEEVRERALPVLRADRADFPDVELVADVEPVAAGWARFPLGSGSSRALLVRLSERLAPDDAYVSFLGLTASLLAQNIDRIAARAAEHGLAEALQRSLLTEPPQLGDFEIAVRYRPAAEQAQVGGDWYDAFLTPDGSPTLVVGDVTGHDQQAAATMAQIRNLVRGVSYALQASPSRVLAAIDDAMHGLVVDEYVTAIVARVEDRTLRWSNAGHLPPVLIAPDGTASLLATKPEMLLGLAQPARTDHTVALEPGATVVFYTDGLVERRSVSIDEGLAWLTGALAGCHHVSAEDLSDHLLAQLDATVEDDVVLLILRVA